MTRSFLDSQLFLFVFQILRLMKGYDEYNTILLPPRRPTEKLPAELLEYFEEQTRKLEEAERLKKEAEEAAAEQARKEQEEAEGKNLGNKILTLKVFPSSTIHTRCTYGQTTLHIFQ